MFMKNYISFFLISFLSLSTHSFSTSDEKIMNENVKQLISYEEIQSKIKDFSSQLKEQKQDQDLVLICVLKGAICFANDLLKHLPPSTEIDFVRCKSYDKEKRKELQVIGLDLLQVKNKNVLVADEIFDSGNTMATIISQIKQKGPKSVKSVVLLQKKTEHITKYRPDYSLFDVDDKFVIGYGLDYDQKCRGLNGVFYIKK
jgi:hypoxanthine phosphoribosyltransferase